MKEKRKVVFKIISIFMLMIGILGGLDSILDIIVGDFLINNIIDIEHNSIEGFIFMSIGIIGIINSILYFSAGIYGLHSLKSNKPKIETAQIFSITLIGLSLLTLCLSIFTTNLSQLELTNFIFTVSFSIIYYIFAKIAFKNEFWKNIRNTEQSLDINMEIFPNSKSLLEKEKNRIYTLNKGIISEISYEQIDDKTSYIETTSKKDFFSKYKKYNLELLQTIFNRNYSSIEILEDCFVGTVAVPVKNNLLKQKLLFSFYLDSQKLIFLDDTNVTESLIQKIQKEHLLKLNNVCDVFFEIFGIMIKYDYDFLQEYKSKLNLLENNMVEDAIKIPKDFYNFVLQTKKELRVLSDYYETLIDIGKILESASTISIMQNQVLFKIIEQKVEKLQKSSINIMEYAENLLSMYQTKIDVRQNRIMQLLTIVTTIFMPLTLITGWYGMNFTNMPELQFKYAYLIVIVISLIIIISEFIIFKKKKWF